MLEKDLRTLAEMKARGDSPESVSAYFKVMGYSEENVLAAFEKVKPVDVVEESVPVKIVAVKEKKRRKSQKLVAILLVFCFLAIFAYTFFPEQIPGLPFDTNQKTTWVVSSVVDSCSPSGVMLFVTNADITGMPITQFYIKENNATCSPPSNFESSGIGGLLTCPGTFKDGATYILISNNTIDDGFVCRYQ